MTKNQMDFKNKQNLELDDQGGNEVPPSGWDKLGWPNPEMGPLGFPRICEPWLNADHHSSMPFSWQKTDWILKTNKISNWMTKEATTFLLVVATSSADLIQRWDHLVFSGNVNLGQNTDHSSMLFAAIGRGAIITVTILATILDVLLAAVAVVAFIAFILWLIVVVNCEHEPEFNALVSY
jgi:hypothetical protein